MSGELLDRIQELLMEKAALEADIRQLEAELSQAQCAAARWERLCQGNVADLGLDKPKE